MACLSTFIFFFFNDTATTEIYTLSLHDALPISFPQSHCAGCGALEGTARITSRPMPDSDCGQVQSVAESAEDRKSTRLNSSHLVISYAVFCLKKKNKRLTDTYDGLRCSHNTQSN